MNMDTPGDTILLGTKAGLRIPSTDCWNGSIGGPLVIYHEVAGDQVETVIPMKENSGGSNFDKKIRSFIDAVKYDLPAPVKSTEIIYNQAMIDGIVKSSKARREIEIEIPEI